MDSAENDIRAHIALAARPAAGEGLTWRIFNACWPSGSEDQTQPFARLWFQTWRPAEVAPEFRSCSCATGRCLLCN